MEIYRSVLLPILAYSARSILWVLLCIAIGLFLGGLLFGEALDPSPLFAKKTVPVPVPAPVLVREVPKVVEPVAPPKALISNCQRQVNQAMMDNQILFSIGQATIKIESHEMLDQLSNILLRCAGFTIQINGHSDNTGSSGANTALSKRRAESVKNYFSRRGVTLSKMKVMGYGSSRPIANNTTSLGRSKNRRIEIIFNQVEKTYKVEIL